MRQPELATEQVLLARLLSDGGRLGSFISDRAGWLDDNAADPAARSALLAIPAEDLLAQRGTLVAKRWRAVLELLPESSFGNPGFCRAIFEDYADRYWPEGHMRHERDALAFLQFCQSKGIAVSRVEIARLELRLGLRRFHILPVRLSRRGRLRPALLLMHRTGPRSCREHLIASL
ncbi:MAG: hypothetical protein H7A35_11225 [Planctomycetales bacterium]|nr:hypothetical protein [bacterium]UNM07434.1 MAG: hypothetical protein H7A35_11225 [Planctomycetales bacterium]